MEREDLERYLERGDTLGFRHSPTSAATLGFVLLSKIKPHDRYISLLTEEDETEFVAKQEVIRQKPYQVLVQEIKRSVYESDRYETNEDFELNERYYFGNLDEVEEFVQKYNHSLSDIKWPIEIDAP